jgi:hypothetical protein
MQRMKTIVFEHNIPVCSILFVNTSDVFDTGFHKNLLVLNIVYKMLTSAMYGFYFFFGKYLKNKVLYRWTLFFL